MLIAALLLLTLVLFSSGLGWALHFTCEEDC